jgi:hypothetical protein
VNLGLGLFSISARRICSAVVRRSRPDLARSHNRRGPAAWLSLQTLIKTVRFFDYEFDTRISGEYNQNTPPFVYRFRHHDKPSSLLWVVFSGWGTGKHKPISQDVTINITPAPQVTVTDMLGKSRTVQADSSGSVVVTASNSPLYLKTIE